MRCELDKQFFSHNVRDFNADKEEKLLDFMCESNIFVCGIQETWRSGCDVPKKMVLSLFIMGENRNVARKEDFLVAWLFFSVLMPKKDGFQRIRRSFTSVTEFSRKQADCKNSFRGCVLSNWCCFNLSETRILFSF